MKAVRTFFICAVAWLFAAQPLEAAPPSWTTGVYSGHAGLAVTFSTSTGVLFDRDVSISTPAQPLAVFTGTTSGTTLTVSSVTSGTIAIGQTITGGTFAVPPGVPITISSGSGTSWTLSASNTNATPATYTMVKPWTANALGGVTNTNSATVAFWLNGVSTGQSGGQFAGMLNHEMFNTNGGSSICEPGIGSFGWCVVPSDNSVAGTQISFNDSTGGTAAAHGINLASSSPIFSSGVWNFYIASYTQGHCILYHAVQGGSATSSGTCPANIATSIINDLANANGAFLWRGGSAVTGVGALQDFYASTAYVGCTGVGAPQADCTGDNTIAPSTLQRFIDKTTGFAVDLKSDCSGPTGSQPPICFTGDSAAMQINKGYATGFSLHGPGGATLALDANLNNQAYGAAQTPGVGALAHEVVLKGVVFSNFAPNQTQAAGSGACSTTCTYGLTNSGLVAFPNSGGQPLAIGDVRILVVGEQAATPATNPAPVCPTTNSGTWTLLTPPGSGPWDATQGNAGFICWIKVTSGSEQDSVAGLQWTGSMVGRGWAMATYANVSSVQQTKGVSQAASTSMNTPSDTLPATASKLVSIWLGTEGSGGNRYYTYGGTGVTRLRASSFGSAPIFIVDEDVAASANTQRTLTRNISTHGTSLNFYLSLVPN